MTLHSELRKLIEQMLQKKASDLVLTEGQPPLLRIDGDLRDCEGKALTSGEIERLFLGVLSEEQRVKFERELELDAAFGLENIARFRLNVFKQQGRTGAVIRMLSHEIPTLGFLGVPPVVKQWLMFPHGILIVTGPTGSGKSTTQAAMIGYLNQQKRHHVVTIEDPVEYEHRHGTCTIEQREVGRDTHSFSNALKSVFRQTPDVVMIGEMRDRETVESALQLAETGHLILTTLHTGDAMQAISRMVDIFPPEQHQHVRVQLSLTLIGVLVQQLVPSLDGSKRMLATEILQANSAVRNLIRKNELQQIYSIIQTGSEEEMRTMNQSLLQLFQAGKISLEQAKLFTTRQKEFEDLVAKRTKVPVYV